MNGIDSKSHKKNRIQRQQKLFNQSYKVKITPLVIYGLGGIRTHINKHIYVRPHKSDSRNQAAICHQLITGEKGIYGYH